MKKTLLLIITLVLFIFLGCNNDDNNAIANTETDESLVLIISGLANVNYSTFNGFEYGSGWSQQFVKVQYNDEQRYIPRQGSISHVWEFWYNRIEELEGVYQYGVTTNNRNLQAVALTLKAYTFSLLTDMFGDIPYYQATTSNTPQYDLQETVYQELFDTLDQALSLYNSTNTINPEYDVLYFGDTSKWKKFTASLKFRLLMRASNKISVSSQLQALITNNILFSSEADDAKYNYSGIGTDSNPIYETIIFNTRGEYKSSETMYDFLKEGLDPRTQKILGQNSLGEYTPYTSMYNQFDISPLGDLYLRAELPAYFISYAELEFLKAEATYKGFISGSTETHFNNGVRASFEANELTTSDANSYLTNYPYNPTNALEQIGEQKYIAIFLHGFEPWTTYRRTGYPVLSPYSSGVINQIPSRLNYPRDEQTNNTFNYDAAVSSQGEDNLTTHLWWQN